jgi:hypothetical protein
MHHEGYTVKVGDTFATICVAYGYKATDVAKVWGDPRNAGLVRNRTAPANIRPGDLLIIPIPWVVTSSSLTNAAGRAQIKVERDGELGTQLTWVQTVYQHNQPIGTTTAYCVDGCPADDNLPFYWTDAELAANPNLRKTFSDGPSRRPPRKARPSGVRSCPLRS